MLVANGQQTMGVGLPWAIAACLARPGDRVISISGDGGFLMSAAELETAVRLNCHFVHIVCRDGHYDMVRFQEELAYGRPSGVDFGPVDTVRFAESMGATGFSIDRAADFGAGTFEDLDGEMLALDSHFFQVHCTGQVVEPGDRAMARFAVVTFFRPDHELSVERADSFDSLTAQLDRLRRTDNLFYAVRIDGHFEHVKTRAVCRVATSARLIQATSSQAEFAFDDVEGTLVGFWTPTYAHNINIPGWHLHFVSRDRSGGGHLLDCRAEQLRVAFQELADLRTAMPETAAFLQADLSKDPTRDLAVAEGEKHRQLPGERGARFKS